MSIRHESHRPSGTQDLSTAALLRGVVADARDLIGEEARAVKLDLEQQFILWRQGLIWAAVGGSAVGLGVFVLLLSMARLLSEAAGVPLWISYLIVGAAFVAIGTAIMITGARKTQRIVDDVVDVAKQPIGDLAWIKEESTSKTE